MTRLPKPARALLQAAIGKAGSAHALGRALETDTGWISRLNRGKAKGLPSPLLVAKLARYTDVDPLDALQAFGHGELVDLLRG